MTVRPVVKMGNPILAALSAPVQAKEFNTPELRALVRDMRETMLKEDGVGIAAPQIGINKRVVIIGFEKNDRYPNEKPVPFTILINPTIDVLSDTMKEDWEGCLSVPGLRGLVLRYETIRYTGYNIEGNAIVREVSGFHARIVQHECDHLDGVLFPQRIKDMRNFGYKDELDAVVAPVIERKATSGVKARGVRASKKHHA